MFFCSFSLWEKTHFSSALYNCTSICKSDFSFRCLFLSSRISSCRHIYVDFFQSIFFLRFFLVTSLAAQFFKKNFDRTKWIRLNIVLSATVYRCKKWKFLYLHWVRTWSSVVLTEQSERKSLLSIKLSTSLLIEAVNFSISWVVYCVWYVEVWGRLLNYFLATFFVLKFIQAVNSVL